MSSVAGNPTRIHLLGSGREEEFKAAGAIKPGHLIKIDSSGEAVVHATAGGPAEKLFAIEDALQGKTIAHSYADDDKVFAVLAAPGDVIYSWVSGGENIVIGDLLTSNGDGTLKEATGADIRIAVALEAVDASDSNDVDERLKVRIL